MKLRMTAIALFIVSVVSVMAQSGGNSVAKDSRVFEMRTYYAAPGSSKTCRPVFATTP